MSSRPELKLDWCSHQAAKYAVEHWHYSRTMPAGKLARLGVWESGSFIGSIIFGTGACPQIARPFGLDRLEVCELVRVALKSHFAPVSRIVSIALLLLKRQFSGLRLVVSYADPEQGHTGKIYQAGNWLYLGTTSPVEWFVAVATGKRIHTKTLKTGRRGYATKLKQNGQIKAIHLQKFKYAMPLDAEMRRQIEPLAKPYPKRAGSIGVDAPGDQPGEGGSTPTPALQKRCENRKQNRDGSQGRKSPTSRPSRKGATSARCRSPKSRAGSRAT